MALAERAGLFALARGHLTVTGPCAANADLKIGCLVAGMAAGADSIDDMDLLRHGAMPELFDGVRAPSTLGSFLRAFTFGNVSQLEKVSRELLAELARRAPLLPGADQLAFVDIDSTQRRVDRDQKHGPAVAHTPLPPHDPAYPRAAWDDQLRCWVSDAEIAEIPYTAFASKKSQAVTARLIVRRVKDLNHKAGQGQGELFAVWRYHPVFTDSPFILAQAEAQHRDHAEIEQVFADWTSGPMAHLPSGSFAANAAWLALAAIAHNLLRAAGLLASPFHGKARGTTIRADLIDVAARIARHGRGHLTLHLPSAWHRQAEWLSLFQSGCRPPRNQAA